MDILLRCKWCALYHQESIVSRCIFNEILRILSCMRSRPIQNLLCTRSRPTPDVARAHQSIPARRQRGAVVRPSRSSCRGSSKWFGLGRCSLQLGERFCPSPSRSVTKFRRSFSEACLFNLCETERGKCEAELAAFTLL